MVILSQKSIIFGWSSRPRKVKKGHATGTECLIDVWSSAWKQWLSKSCRIVRDTNIQARPGKNFHQKLYISDDSKIFLQICTVDLLSTSSAWQASMVENVKLKHDLDTIFWNFCTIFLHSAPLSSFVRSTHNSAGYIFWSISRLYTILVAAFFLLIYIS